LRRGSLNLHQFPGLLQRVIDQRLWERREVPGYGVVELKSLRELITAKPRRGWGEDPDKIEAVIKDDPKTLTLWHRAMKEKPGRKSTHIVSRNRTTPTGNSRAQALDKLEREYPDLFQRVLGGELSAHAAALTAGFRKQKTPFEQLCHWWAKASDEDRAAFRSFLS